MTTTRSAGSLAARSRAVAISVYIATVIAFFLSGRLIWMRRMWSAVSVTISVSILPPSRSGATQLRLARNARKRAAQLFVQRVGLLPQCMNVELDDHRLPLGIGMHLRARCIWEPGRATSIGNKRAD